MPGKLKLEVTAGDAKGEVHEFDEHDTFLFGRMSDCDVHLPKDLNISRHQFILEANPPDARVRDLGSRNGTQVNGVKHGGREKGESPEDGAKRTYPEVDLKHGDQIRVGKTVFAVHVAMPAECRECGRVIPDEDRAACSSDGGTSICAVCKAKLAASPRPAKGPEPVRCQKCGKDVTEEVGNRRSGDYVCGACREGAGSDPLQVLLALLREAGKLRTEQPAPKIAGYEIEKKIGVGGFGAVYLARRKKDNEKVAVKIMLSRIAVDEPSRKRFLREIDLAKKLKHENIVSLIDNGSVGGAFYFIMPYCEGDCVARLMKRRGGKLTLREAGPLMLQALDGLAYLHANDTVHRDLKPENVLLTGSEGQWTARISDLGLAKNFQRTGLSGPTITGQTAGTPLFMPREQVTNFKRVEPVTDVWSMGATFYNMLTGKFPRDFPRGRDPIEILLHDSAVPIRRRDPRIPTKVAEVIDRALADKTSDRYPTAAEFKDALETAF